MLFKRAMLILVLCPMLVELAGAEPPRGHDEFVFPLDQFRMRLSDKLYQRLGWQPRCKPTVLPSGRILLPLYTDTYSISIMAISDDQGKNWFASKPLLGFGNIQPAVLRRDNGTLVAYMRENGISGRVRVSQSVDDGLTWTVATGSQLPNPGSGLDGMRLASGFWSTTIPPMDVTNSRSHSPMMKAGAGNGRDIWNGVIRDSFTTRR